jgi:membrane protein implicated in regulation of membrane protease activity
MQRSWRSAYDHLVAAWALWMIVAVALAVGEVFTLAFLLGPIALAAVLAGVAAAVGFGALVQVAVFIAGSVGSLAVLRPIARRHLRTPAELRTGTAALVGKRAVVLERVDSDGGRVRLGGEVWSARAFFEGQVLEEGTRVEVAEIEGATALVYE